MQAEFRQLKQKQEYLDAWELVKQLHPQINEAEYWRLLGEMLFAGHLMVGLYLQEHMIGLVGIRKAADWLYGEHLWLHILILAENYGGQGYEHMLLNFVWEWAQAQGCAYVHTTLDMNSFGGVVGDQPQFIATAGLFTLQLQAKEAPLLTSDET